MRILPAPRSKPLCLCYAADSETLYIGCRDGQILAWDRHADTTESVFYHRESTPVVKLAAGSDEVLLAACSREILRIYPGNAEYDEIDALGLGSGLVSVGPVGRLFYTTHGLGQLRCTPVGRPNYHENLLCSGDPLALAAREDAPWVVLGYGRALYGGVHWWRVDQTNLEAGGALGLNSPVCSVAIAPRGHRLAVGMRSGRVSILDPEAEGPTHLLGSFRVTAERKGTDREDGVFGLAFLPDGRELLTVSSDGDAQRWDVESLQQRQRLDWAMGSLRALAFAPNGQTAAAIGQTNEIIVWDVD